VFQTAESGSSSLVANPASGRSVSVFDEKVADKVRRLLDDGTPPNTRKAYASDMRYFWAWCSAIGWADEPVLPVPPEVVARFIADHLEGLDEEVDRDLVERGVKARLGRHSINTIDRRVSTISSFHKAKGLPNPCADPMVVQIMSKARKAAARRGERPRKKKAVIRSILDRMLETCGADRLIDLRDAAILLFGFASGGRRRSEIAEATMENLEAVGDSFIYHMGITKTAQEGDGGSIPVAGRAADALRAWLEASGITEGPIFRSIDRHGNVSRDGLTGRTVARIVQNRARLAGLDPKLYGGHSLRSGFLTEVGLQGKSLLEAMALSRHKTVQVAAGYHQAGAALHNTTANIAD